MPRQPEPGKPVLLVALDDMNLHRVEQIAKEAVAAGGPDDVWLEAGTPLIKSEGLEAVRTLKKAFPDRVIFADMKVMDTGGFETEIAIKAGGDIVGILGASDDGTIVEAVKSARKYGGKVMVDLIRVDDKAGRAKRAQELGADYVSIHVGIDEQMKGASPAKVVKEVVSAVSIPVAVAGGLTSESVGELAAAGASIIVVGGAITKAADVTKATERILVAIREQKVVESAGMKKYDASRLREAFSQVSTPNISDAMHREGAMSGILPVLSPGKWKMVGPAVTVRAMDGDWAKPVEAIDHANPGDVLVIEAPPGDAALWGELASHSCKVKGVAGVVIEGAIRDVDEIRKIAFPAFARVIRPNAGDPKGFGEIGIEVKCGGQRVRSGDWIIGDESGVVVVPKDDAVEIANRALDVKEREDRLREEIERGSTLSKQLKLKKWEKVVG